MNDYFDGAFRELHQRCILLIDKIPRTLPREFHLLEQTCRNRLNEIRISLEELLNLKTFQNKQIQIILLRELKATVQELNYYELVAITALNRTNEDDKFLNQLIENIRQEINYPLLPPVVSAISQGYFYIYNDLNLLCVPLAEADFILHLPDLYHELAHPLLDDNLDSRACEFSNYRDKSLDFALFYLSAELEKESRSRNPVEYTYYIQTWIRSWFSWATEFFCDLFATFTLGPAYAWANIHLCAKTSPDLFYVPRYKKSDHPADDARMRAILLALNKLGYGTLVTDIDNRWKSLRAISHKHIDEQYFRCFPDQIIEFVVEQAYLGVQKMGCRIAVPDTAGKIHTTLNEAWTEFWKNPQQYTQWERETVNTMRNLYHVEKS